MIRVFFLVRSYLPGNLPAAMFIVIRHHRYDDCALLYYVFLACITHTMASRKLRLGKDSVPAVLPAAFALRTLMSFEQSMMLCTDE